MQAQVFIQASEFMRVGPFKLGMLSSGYYMCTAYFNPTKPLNFIQNVFMFCMILGISSDNFTEKN